jgi:homoserine O-acetyltransferase
MQGITRLTNLFDNGVPLFLESGARFNSITVAYETHGELNDDGTNALLICHALTGDAHVAGAAVYQPEVLHAAPLLKKMRGGQEGWWEGLIGPGKVFDTDRYFVVSSNIFGSCYGTTGPASINPVTGKAWGPDFPEYTVRDIVRVQKALLEKLGVNRLQAVAGGSLGGMQVLEWALLYPEMVDRIIPIATAARHSDWAIGLGNVARHAITSDPKWNGGWYTEQPKAGLALARKVGMLSYRTDVNYNDRFSRERIGDQENVFEKDNIFQVESYLAYQGKKLVERFDANTYIGLTNVMDRHDVARGRGDLKSVLGSIQVNTLCIGIDSDLLYPAREQQEIAAAIPNARYAEIKSAAGHDAFLIEFDQMREMITPFLAEARNGMRIAFNS